MEEEEEEEEEGGEERVDFRLRLTAFLASLRRKKVHLDKKRAHAQKIEEEFYIRMNRVKAIDVSPLMKLLRKDLGQVKDFLKSKPIVRHGKRALQLKHAAKIKNSGTPFLLVRTWYDFDQFPATFMDFWCRKRKRSGFWWLNPSHADSTQCRSHLREMAETLARNQMQVGTHTHTHTHHTHTHTHVQTTSLGTPPRTSKARTNPRRKRGKAREGSEGSEGARHGARKKKAG